MSYFGSQRKHLQAGEGRLLTLQVHLMSEGTEPRRQNLTSNSLQDRATLWTKIRYLLALTDLSWQLSGLKCWYGRATDKNKYKAVSDTGAEETLAHTTCAAAPVCVSLVGARARWALQAAQSPHWVGRLYIIYCTGGELTVCVKHLIKKQNHPAILRSGAAKQLSHSFYWLTDLLVGESGGGGA